ncbi:SAM-dependent methyltransferase [Candidatus Contendibacter odensensis]|uniref:Cyclopropane-fatty-acyl-phospholipid synthase n=1 Tax=Candidatus Contendobacter odensis Run_B_J11 TaxID=1400861 RepID=A0A7U7GAZ5_9GAMM|nr:cyclopropane-fatty-acyl-phospholipid synthase family protein [Candidatus Contendobacter odensis]MBK8750753.1 class I SAM-dependent methyltransferase [Candidatus Competibacteraceae bacterium]CDH45006.1 putative cyclopropane-fatty-acyl-phospholipid synthase [Candidatus Contendobacter odensis Run_B_J11]
MLNIAIDLMERGYVPDGLIRIGIRRLLAQRLRAEEARDEQVRAAALEKFIVELRASPIALHTTAANAQHYELPAGFFQKTLGPRLKYSSCWWPEEVRDLETAEAAMLALSCERAELGFDQDILELGCGWGSLTLWMAEFYPDSRIVAVSNSHSQREFIEAQCQQRRLENVQVVTADINDFCTDRRFDRVVSVEMFEHMRNYQALMARIQRWLKPGGKLFVHLFTHRLLAYPFETEGDDNWMGRYFFTGGLMPSRDLLPRFQDDLQLQEQWHFNGRHYQRTLETWLINQDRYRGEIMPIFSETYGTENAERWFQRWRVFFMACAELFGYRCGEEWGVSHYRFGNRG